MCKRSLSIPRARRSAALAVLCCLLLPLSVTGFAAEAAPAKLSAADAIAKALNDNPRLKQAEESRNVSLSELRKANFLTRYGIGARSGVLSVPGDKDVWGRAFGEVAYEGLGGTTAAIALSPFGFGTERAAVALELRRPLIRGAGLLSPKSDRVAGAHIDASIEEKQLYLERQSTVFGAIQAYYRAVLAAELVKVEERAVSLAEQQAQTSRRRVDEGLATGIDLSRSEIRLAQVKDGLNRQQRSEREAMDDLMLAIGSPVGHAPELTDPVPEPVGDTPALAESVKTALKNRAELGVFDDQLADQSRLLSLAKDQLRPGLDAFARYDSSRPDEGFASSSLFNSGSFIAGLEYTFSIDKRVDTENRDTAQRGLELTRRLRVYQMEQIAEQVQNAFRRVESARASLNILTQNRKVTEENLALAQIRLDEGIADNRDVVDAQASLVDTQAGILEARTELYLAGVNLNYAMGEDLAALGAK